MWTHREWVERTRFTAIQLVTFVLIFGISVIRPTVTYRALELGAGPTALGVIAASFALLSMVLAIPVGRLIDRSVPGTYIVIGTASMLVVALVLMDANSLVLLALSQTALGMAHLVGALGCQTAIANGDPRRREMRFGNFAVAVSVGQLAGPAAATAILSGSMTVAVLSHHLGESATVFGLTAVIQFAGTLLALLAVTLDQERRRRRPAPAKIGVLSSVVTVMRARRVPTAIFASIAVVTTGDVLVAYLPAFGQDNGISIGAVGGLLSTMAGASIISRLALRQLRRRIDVPPLLLIGTAAPAVLLALFPPAHSLALRYVLFALAGLGIGVSQPLSMSWVAGSVPADLQATSLSIRLAGNRIAQVLIPLLVGVAASLMGLQVVFYGLSVLLFCAGMVVARGMWVSRQERLTGTPSAERPRPVYTPQISSKGPHSRS